MVLTPPVQQSFFRQWLKTIIFFLMERFFLLYKKKVSFPQNPKGILVCNMASFGDVVISTVVLPVLKKHYPEAEIGFLVSMKMAEVLKRYPDVARIHTIDHWYHKEERGFLRAIPIHLKDFCRVIREIKQYRYEIGIDLYPHFFLSAIPFLWRAKIPVRVGRFIQGYSNLLTHIGAPNLPEVYMGQSHLDLLNSLNIDTSQQSPFPIRSSFTNRSRFLPKEYVVIHMGTSRSLKEWPTDKWIVLVKALIDRGEKIILTGRGAREEIECDRVSLQTGCMNVCNQLNWAEFTHLIQQAKLLISVDSASIHIASAVQLPCIVLFSGISSIPVWKPPYPNCKALMKQVACAPCLLMNGCSRMSCIQEIEVVDVLKSVEELESLWSLQLK